MSHFARVNAQGIVEEVIVAEQDFIDALPNASSWVQTSYNTFGGQHPEGRPLRKNFAGIGFRYDPQRDAFISPQPFPSWVLVEETCLWSPPVAMPAENGPYYWDEASLSWKHGFVTPDVAVEVLP